MKNKFIINNDKVQFLNLIEQVSSTDVTNVLQHDFDKYTFMISKCEFEKYILPVVQSDPLIGAVSINVNPTTSNNGSITNIFTNMTDSYFNIEPIIDRSEFVIPTINSNLTNFATLDITYDIGCSKFIPVTKLKDELWQTFRGPVVNKSKAFIYPISDNAHISTVESYMGNVENNTFSLYCTFKEPTYVNTFSLDMVAVSSNGSKFTELLTNPNNISDLCRNNLAFTYFTYAYRPESTVSIYGLNENTGNYELLFNGNRKRGSRYNVNSWQYRYRSHYGRDYRYDEIKWSNFPFRNTTNYTTYKMTVTGKNVNGFTRQNFGKNINLIKSTKTINYLNNQKTLNESVISDIKQISYRYKKNSTLSGDVLLSNIKVIENENNIDVECNITPSYKWSFKYGDLITGMNVSIISYDINNYNELNDSTIIDTIYVEIQDTKEPISFTLNKSVAELSAIETYNIEFEILYDIDRFETLFSANDLEQINVNDLLCNYDYNFKYPNKSSVSNKQPKQIHIYSCDNDSNGDISTFTILKNKINTINIQCQQDDIVLNIKMYNQIYGKIFDGPYEHELVEFGYNPNLVRQRGLLEVAQCDGTQITKRTIIDKNGNVVTPQNKNTFLAFRYAEYPEQLNWTNGMIFTWDRINNNNEGTFTECTPIIKASKVGRLSSTKYYIVKLLLKPDTSLLNTRAFVANQSSIYRTISISSPQTLQKTTTMVNNITELDNIINDKYVAYYQLDRGAKL